MSERDEVTALLTPETFRALLNSEHRGSTLALLPALYTLIEGDRERLVLDLEIALATAKLEAYRAARLRPRSPG